MKKSEFRKWLEREIYYFREEAGEGGVISHIVIHKPNNYSKETPDEQEYKYCCRALETLLDDVYYARWKMYDEVRDVEIPISIVNMMMIMGVSDNYMTVRNFLRERFAVETSKNKGAE